MSKFFNLYENIDLINPVDLKRAAGLKDPEGVSWPKGKKYKVQLAGTECTVTTSFSGLDGRVNGNLDAFSALSTMLTREEVEARIWKEDPNARSDAVYYAQPEFLPGLPDLTEDEKEHRRAFTAAILTLLSDQKTIEYLAECAPRKKNGLFHKGRVFKIGLTGFAERYSNELLEIVGKSKDETKLTISVIGRSTSPDELDAWTQDFISTYHEGLPISEALNKIFETINEKTSPECNSSESEETEGILKDVPNELRPFIICPEDIDFIGKTFVFDYSIIMREVDGEWLYMRDYKIIENKDPDVAFRITGQREKNDPENPIVGETIEAGGIVRRDISGKTDYYIKDMVDPFSEVEIKKILEQKEKGKPLMVIPMDVFKTILSKG